MQHSPSPRRKTPATATVARSLPCPPASGVGAGGDASALLTLSAHLLSHASALEDGSASLLLPLDAITRLHTLRAELQTRLSDRDAVRAGRVDELCGLPVPFLTQLFTRLATLVTPHSHSMPRQHSHTRTNSLCSDWSLTSPLP